MTRAQLDRMTRVPQRPEVPTQPPTPSLKKVASETIAGIPDSLAISSLINVAGSAAVHFMFGIPFDFGVTATFMVVGTLIGAAYFPVKNAMGAWLGSALGHKSTQGAPIEG